MDLNINIDDLDETKEETPTKGRSLGSSINLGNTYIQISYGHIIFTLQSSIYKYYEHDYIIGTGYSSCPPCCSSPDCFMPQCNDPHICASGRSLGKYTIHVKRVSIGIIFVLNKQAYIKIDFDS